MIRPFEAFVGLRYTRARKRSHFISFISLISILGITLGITALITTLSVMNGFGKELRGRILGVISHVTITDTGGQLRDWKDTANRLQNPHIIGRAPYITGQGLVSRGKTVSGVMVRGILPDEELQVSEFGQRMIEGRLESLKPGEFGVVIGSALAWKLDLTLGSPVSLVIPQGLVTPAGLVPRFKRFIVVGIFRMDMYEYDNGLVLMHLDDAAKLYQTGDRVSGLRLKLDNLDIAPRTAYELESALGSNYIARDWTREHYDFPGYVTGFDPADFVDREALRHELGYRPDEKVCIVTVGGSGVGEHLLRRVIDSYPEAARRVDGLRMSVVAGPGVGPSSLPSHDGLEIRAYVHDLYRHLAACDLAVVQGGLTTSMELTANRRPFLYFPLRHHFEQNFHVRHRLERYGAGRRMDFETDGPDAIAAAIAEEIGREVDYLPVESGGAARAAALIAELL